MHVSLHSLARYLLAGLATFLIHTSAFALQPLDSVAVVVNDDVITRMELEERIQYYKNQIRLSSGSVSDMEGLKRQVLERMIRDKVQLQQAALLGIQIDDISLNRMIDTMAKQNNMTLNELRSTLQKEGIDFADFRQQSRNELIIQQVQKRMVADKVTVTDQEVKQFIESNAKSDTGATEYHLLHILIAIPEDAAPDDIQKAGKEADDVYNQLQQGENFKELAIRVSDGSNALNGGDLGIRKANELPEMFLKAIAELSVGDISKPVKSASGFHILKVAGSDKKTEMVTQTHARHILIKTDADTTDDEAREILQKLRAQLEQGADFAELAGEYSADPGSKDKGGDLGWATPGMFVPAFERVMNSLQIGQLSEPFKSKFGWHILQVIERREHDMAAQILEAKARQAIMKRKIDEELRLWLRRIRDEAYVDYVDASLKPAE